jgi:ABC-type Fe3+ transport system permease subunit
MRADEIGPDELGTVENKVLDARTRKPVSGPVGIDLLVRSLGLSEPPFNIYTMTGMIFIGGLRHVPVMFLLLAVALRSMDPALEESAAT